jgi:hypothetical protein
MERGRDYWDGGEDMKWGGGTGIIGIGLLDWRDRGLGYGRKIGMERKGAIVLDRSRAGSSALDETEFFLSLSSWVFSFFLHLLYSINNQPTTNWHNVVGYVVCFIALFLLFFSSLFFSLSSFLVVLQSLVSISTSN